MERTKRAGSRPFVRMMTLAACAFAGGFVATAAHDAILGASRAEATPTAASPYENLAIFARALSHIEASHVEPPDQDTLVYGAIRGMVETLDPHSSFLTPDQYRMLMSDTQGQFGGIGIEVDVRDGWLVVHGVMEGGPAEAAGLRAGDRFLAIDGLGARDMRLSEAVEHMRGAPGTPVTIRIRREGVDEGIELTLNREIIHVDAVEARVLSDRVVYARIRSFSETTTDELRAALDRAVTETAAAGGLRGVLLDLRGNPGGLLDEAVRVSDEFLESGVIVSTRGRDGQVLDEASARRAGTRPDWPMVVLVDHYSASAAEIVAGALHDHHRATLVGQRTWGKGSVQNLIELPDGSALKLTIARYYTPSGVSIQARGIDPDVVVEDLDAETIAALRERGPVLSEAMLEGHLESESTTPADATTREEMRRPTPTADEDAFGDDVQARTGHQVLATLIAEHERR
jgi:carboxyl-terminal processing protease